MLNKRKRQILNPEFRFFRLLSLTVFSTAETILHSILYAGIAFIFLSQCTLLYPSYKTFIVKHYPPSSGQVIPGQNSKGQSRPVLKEAFYILTPSEEYTKGSGTEYALSGNWKMARKVWNNQKKETCVVYNNLAMASLMNGLREEASVSMSKALSLCPENQRIISNFRSLTIVADGDK